MSQARLDLWLQPIDQAALRWAEERSSMLDEQETRRWRRYLKGESRALFLVAHVMTRTVLSRYVDCAPETWQFHVGTNGRPEIVGGPPGMRFNMSHTNGMVAVLVHEEADCGVDAEHIRRPTDISSVSRRVFTNAERTALFSQPAELQADRFYQLWTLKEAFIKAKGKGFALPLKQFGFTMSNNQDRAEQIIEFDCDPAIDPAPKQWHFFTHRSESGHMVSIAAHQGPTDGEPSIIIRQSVHEKH